MGYFGLMLTIFIGYIICENTLYLFLIIIVSATGIAFIFAFVNMILWNTLRCKFNTS